MTKDEALDLALEALELNNDEWKLLADSGDCGYWNAEDQDHYKKTSEAITAIKQARSAPTVQEPLSELEKDAANLLFALHDAWPYVHRHCTIESKKKTIQALMVKHGDFADLQPPAAQPAPVTLISREQAARGITEKGQP